MFIFVTLEVGQQGGVVCAQNDWKVLLVNIKTLNKNFMKCKKRPAPDAEAVKALKRKKLEIKEKMAEADKSET